MRKMSLLFLTLLFTVALTVSCSSTNKPTSVSDTFSLTSTAPVISSTAETTTQAFSGVQSAASTSGASSAPAAGTTGTAATQAAPDSNLYAILSGIVNLEEGTAGSSLKHAAAAGKILDWVESTSLSQTEIESQITFYLSVSSYYGIADTLASNFNSISNTAQLIIDADANTLGSLTDAGYTPEHTDYTQSKWDAFVVSIQVTTDAF